MKKKSGSLLVLQLSAVIRCLVEDREQWEWFGQHVDGCATTLEMPDRYHASGGSTVPVSSRSRRPDDFSSAIK
jgi:hypothetical protein